MPLHHIPSGYRAITPILVVVNADALLEFAKGAFDAQEHRVTRRSDGRILHADITIEGEHLMFSESHGGDPPNGAAVNIYVVDTDAAFQRALAAGASSVMPPTNRFYGDRNAVVKDSSGALWSIATHIEDVPPDELSRREAAAIRQMEQRNS